MAKFGISIVQSLKDDNAVDEDNVCQLAPVLPVAVKTCPIVGAVADATSIVVVADFNDVALFDVYVIVRLLVPSFKYNVFASLSIG